jgi:hypothetical protein
MAGEFSAVGFSTHSIPRAKMWALYMKTIMLK